MVVRQTTPDNAAGSQQLLVEVSVGKVGYYSAKAVNELPATGRGPVHTRRSKHSPRPCCARTRAPRSHTEAICLPRFLFGLYRKLRAPAGSDTSPTTFADR